VEEYWVSVGTRNNLAEGGHDWAFDGAWEA